MRRVPGVKTDPVKPCATTMPSDRSGCGRCSPANRTPSRVTRRTGSNPFTCAILTQSICFDTQRRVSRGAKGTLVNVLLMTDAEQPTAEVLPALGLLIHDVTVVRPEMTALLDAPAVDVLLVDARRDLVAVRSLLRLLTSTGVPCPMIAVVTEGGLTALRADWGVDDLILDTAGPAELEARLRLSVERRE